MDYTKLTKRRNVDTVLGIDVSTNSLAFCLYGRGGPIKWGEVTFSGANTFERLADARVKIAAIRSELKADMIVMESAVYVQNRRTVIQLAYAFGAVLSGLLYSKTQVEELTPTEWQFAIGNKTLNASEKKEIQDANPGKSKTWYSARYREERKMRTMRWVEQTYGIKCPSDNVSDAIGIASVGHSRFASPTK